MFDGRFTDATASIMTETFTLSLQQIASQRRISNAVLNQSELHSWVDPVMGDLVASLQAYVAADQVIDEIVTAHASVDEWASWWQHTKASLFPTLSRWLRRPPRKTSRLVSVDFHAEGLWAFPDADIYPVQLGAPIKITRVDWEAPRS